MLAFLIVLISSTAIGALIHMRLLSYLHRIAPNGSIWVPAIAGAFFLSSMAMRAAYLTNPDDPPGYLSVIPLVILGLSVRYAMYVDRQRRSAGPQGSSPGGELVGTGGTTIGRGLLPLPTPMWPTLLAAVVVVVAVALAVILGK